MSQRLSTHIGVMLQRHSSAIVPGLGGFILETIPAYYDSSKQLAYPPKTELHFNEALNHQDGLLEAHYASVYGVSLRRGRLMLEEDVRTLRSSLLTSTEYVLEGLGRLQHLGNGKVSFLPEVSINLSADAYGLSPVSIPMGGAGNPIPAEEQDPRYLYLRLSKRWVGVAAVVATIALALYPFGRVREPQAHYAANFIPSELSAIRLWGDEVKAQPIDSLPTTKSDTTENTEAIKLSSPKAEVQAPLSPTPDQRYYIVVGSERKVERAEVFASGVRGELPKVDILHTGRMHRITVGSYSQAEEAYRALNDFIASHPKYKTAWVFHNK